MAHNLNGKSAEGPATPSVNFRTLQVVANKQTITSALLYGSTVPSKSIQTPSLSTCYYAALC